MEEYIQKLHEVASKGYSNSVERDVFRKMVLGPEAMFGDRHTILFSTPSETRQPVLHAVTHVVNSVNSGKAEMPILSQAWGTPQEGAETTGEVETS